MKIVDILTINELSELANKMYGNLVKADIDIKNNILVIDMGMHADGEAYLLEQGSKQNDLWGINLHPSNYGTNKFIEFDSMINIRPSQGNPSRDILDASIKDKITALVMERIRE